MPSNLTILVHEIAREKELSDMKEIEVCAPVELTHDEIIHKAYLATGGKHYRIVMRISDCVLPNNGKPRCNSHYLLKLVE